MKNYAQVYVKTVLKRRKCIVKRLVQRLRVNL